jgi:CBS domain-containing protein
MLVKDVMTRTVVTVAPSLPLQRAARVLVEHRVSGLPVVEERRVVGVISQRDFVVKEQGVPAEPGRLARLRRRGRQIDAAKSVARTVRGAMTSPAVTVTPSTPVAVAARRMVRADVNRLPVLDGDDLVGIVSRTDLVAAFARTDAEIHREVAEEVLARQLLVDTVEVRTIVRDGNVTIEGARHADVDDAFVKQLVARVPGVVSVVVRG